MVSTQQLVYEIWGDRPPSTAVKAVKTYVMRLRRLLGQDGASLLTTRNHGYELVIGEGDLDVWAFERLAGAGRAELAAGRPDLALSRFTEALVLWRGSVLADVPDRPAWAARATQLEQARLAATEDRLRALLELGRHQEAVDQLHLHVEEHPLRELLWTLLMRAQYACGRRAAALETFQRARRVLSEELGLEPGEPLRQLQREILASDRPLAGAAEDRLPAALPPTAPVAGPAQLPADVTGFTGREGQLKQLDQLLATTGDTAAVVISAINGTAGVGKTALAVHWAYRARRQFADGQLYMDLRGWSQRPPVRPLEALAWFLEALGVPPERVPSTMRRQAACTGACSPTGRCWWCSTTPAMPNRCGRWCRAARVVWPWSPAAITCRATASPLPRTVLPSTAIARLLDGCAMATLPANQPLTVAVSRPGSKACSSRRIIASDGRRCGSMPNAAAVEAGASVTHSAIAV